MLPVLACWAGEGVEVAREHTGSRAGTGGWELGAGGTRLQRPAAASSIRKIAYIGETVM